MGALFYIAANSNGDSRDHGVETYMAVDPLDMVPIIETLPRLYDVHHSCKDSRISNQKATIPK
eukprot:scaffold378648_cov17-Prasinocladus_malaysianus.AAC.1